MKKLFSILTATAIVFGMSVSAYAAPFDPFENLDLEDKSFQTNDNPKDWPIPVYGYILSADADIVDDKPDDENHAPTAASLINVAVPVKIVWATLKSQQTGTAPNLTAPVIAADYAIKNLSPDDPDVGSKLNVSVKTFSKVSDTTNDAYLNAVEQKLTLNLVNTSTSAVNFDPVTLLGTSGYLPTQTTLKQSSSPIELDKQETLGFTIGGEFKGDFPKDSSYTPEYNIVFEFGVVTP